MAQPSPRTFTPTELATLSAEQVEALPPADRQAFFLQAARATDPFYPHHLEDTAPRVYLEDFIQGDYDLVDTNRRFELGE